MSANFFFSSNKARLYVVSKNMQFQKIIYFLICRNDVKIKSSLCSYIGESECTSTEMKGK